MTTLRSWRMPTWLFAAWTLLFGILLIADVARPGAPDAIAFFLTSSAPVSLQTWALGAVPLALLWYATGQGVSRLGLGLALLATAIALAALLATREWPVEAPPAAVAAPLLGPAGDAAGYPAPDRSAVRLRAPARGDRP
ncbi:MAG: hypothetical protein WCK58_18385 [Chloroflexota bacterium]